METLPYSMIRMRLRPGTHRIAFEFEGKRNPIDVSGAAGDVRFVRIGDEVGGWDTSYSWEPQSEEKIRKRATKTRLVADIRILSDDLDLNSGRPSSIEGDRPPPAFMPARVLNGADCRLVGLVEQPSPGEPAGQGWL